jgi:hypothetical protein
MPNITRRTLLAGSALAAAAAPFAPAVPLTSQSRAASESCPA